MEEIEASTEALEEEIHHQAHGLDDAHSSHNARERWISQVALSSALLAVFAAIGALLSNHHANEAMIEQIQVSDKWSYYQAKGIKANLLATKLDLLESLGRKAPKKELEKLATYKAEQDDIASEAKEKEETSEKHLRNHLVLARGVTLFQVAIAIAAISVLTRRRRFWYLGIAFGTIGLGFLVQGVFW